MFCKPAFRLLLKKVGSAAARGTQAKRTHANPEGGGGGRGTPLGPKQLAARRSGKRQRRAARAALGSREVGSTPQIWRRRFRNGPGAQKGGVDIEGAKWEKEYA